MDNTGLELVRKVHRKEIERLRAMGEPKPEPPPIPHSELPELSHEHELHREWNTYRFHVAEFLASGLAGVWILVKGDNVLGAYGRWEFAYIAALEKALLHELSPPFLIHQIRANESATQIERIATPWPRSPSPLAKTA
jgi:hypothetical protein